MQPPALPARWNVSEPTLIAETFSSRIWKVSQTNGMPAIVKALKDFDDVEDELRGAHLLAWRRGEGLIRLFDSEDKMDRRHGMVSGIRASPHFPTTQRDARRCAGRSPR